MIETKRNEEDTAVVCGLQIKQRAVLNRPWQKEESSSAEIHGESRNPGWMGGRLKTVEGPKSLWLNLNRGAVECQNVLYPASLQIFHVQVFLLGLKCGFTPNAVFLWYLLSKFCPTKCLWFAAAHEQKKGGWNIACPKFLCSHDSRESCQCFLQGTLRIDKKSHLSQALSSLTPLQ